MNYTRIAKEFLILEARLQGDPIHIAPLAAHYARFIVASDRIRRIKDRITHAREGTDNHPLEFARRARDS